MTFDIVLCGNGHAMSVDDPFCDLCGGLAAEGEDGLEAVSEPACSEGHANEDDAPFCTTCGCDLRWLSRCLNGHPVGATASSCNACGAMVVRHAADPLGLRAEPLDAPLDLVLESCAVVGGSGVQLHRGEDCVLRFSPRELTVVGSTSGIRVSSPYTELRLIGLSGGKVTTGGGFIGGGFGLEGAVKGIAIASVANWLSTRTAIHTLIQIGHPTFELFVHHGTLTPAELRIRLSSAFQQLPVQR